MSANANPPPPTHAAFVTNLELPDDLALGRSVSHGFGWFRAAR